MLFELTKMTKRWWEIAYFNLGYPSHNLFLELISLLYRLFHCFHNRDRKFVFRTLKSDFKIIFFILSKNEIRVIICVLSSSTSRRGNKKTTVHSRRHATCFDLEIRLAAYTSRVEKLWLIKMSRLSSKLNRSTKFWNEPGLIFPEKTWISIFMTRLNRQFSG